MKQDIQQNFYLLFTIIYYVQVTVNFEFPLVWIETQTKLQYSDNT